MTETTAEVSIPQRHQEICRELARIAKKHGLQRLIGSYGPSFGDSWSADIAFHWDAGRHGYAENKLTVSSQHFVATKVDPA
jgi:hypothetical protein